MLQLVEATLNPPTPQEGIVLEPPKEVPTLAELANTTTKLRKQLEAGDKKLTGWAIGWDAEVARLKVAPRGIPGLLGPLGTRETTLAPLAPWSHLGPYRNRPPWPHGAPWATWVPYDKWRTMMVGGR